MITLADIKGSEDGHRFREYNLKNRKAHIYKYQKGRFAPMKIEQPTDSRSRPTKPKAYILKEKKLYAVEALVNGGYAIKDAFLLIRAFNALTMRDPSDTNIRYAGSSYKVFVELGKEKCRDYFMYHRDEQGEELGIKAKTYGLDKLSAILDDYVDSKLEAFNHKDGLSYLLYMELKVENFKQMKVADKIRVLKYTEGIHGDIIYVNKYRKRDIGNFGRNSETIIEFPRITRKWFEIYGWDLEAALQNIWYQDCKRIAPFMEFPITLDLITNKKKFRANIAKYVYCDFPQKKALAGAKTFITKIYQGYKKRRGLNEAGLFWLDLIAKEAAEMRALMIEDALSPENIKSDRTKFAIEKTNRKMRSKGMMLNSRTLAEVSHRDKLTTSKRFDMDKSLIFYLWTFSEQEIMDVIHSRIRNPIDLLDARYTQSKTEFEELNKIDWSVLIQKETGYQMKIGVEIYTPES